MGEFLWTRLATKVLPAYPFFSLKGESVFKKKIIAFENPFPIFLSEKEKFFLATSRRMGNKTSSMPQKGDYWDFVLRINLDMSRRNPIGSFGSFGLFFGPLTVALGGC